MIKFADKVFLKLNGIKAKLILAFSLIVIIFNTITVYFWYARYSSDIEASTVSYVSEIIKSANHNFELMIRDINAMVIATSSSKDITDILTNEDPDLSDAQRIDQDRKVQSTMLSMFMYKNYLESILVGSFDGKKYSLGVSIDVKDYEKNPHFDRIYTNKGTIILPPFDYSSKPGGQQTVGLNSNAAISILRPIVSGKKIMGIVAANVNCNVLPDLFNLSLEGDSKIIIFDTLENKVIYDTGAQLAASGDASKLERALEDETQRLKSGSGYFYTEIEGDPKLLVYNHSKFSGWTTIGIVRKSFMFEGYEKTKSRTILLSLVSIIFSIGMAYFISHLLTKNLLKLNKAMKSFDKDNMNISIRIKSHDEVGSLYHQFNNMVARISRLIEEIKISEKDKRKAEMRALQAQINPHFLYNTMNTIKYLSSFYGADNIREVSEALSSILHVNMDHRTFISIREEILYLKSYLGIQEYRYENKFKWGIAIEEGVENLMILKLLLQPLVENALTHGIKPKNGQGNISIKIFTEEGKLIVKIQDDGLGMTEEEIDWVLCHSSHTGGIGISNVLSRIRNNFGQEYGLSITSEKGIYTAVKVILPVIANEDVDKYV